MYIIESYMLMAGIGPSCLVSVGLWLCVPSTITDMDVYAYMCVVY